MTSVARGLVAFVFLTAGVARTATGAPVWISELLYDAVGSDQGAVFVELYGPAGLSLDGFTLEGVNGSGGGVGPVLALTGPIPADGIFVVADTDAGTTGVANADLLLDFDFQNGPDSVVLRTAAGDVADALGYGSFGAGDVFAGEGAAAPDPPAGQSLARVFANVDTDDNATDFVALETPTPGTARLASVPEPTALALLGFGLFACAARRARSPDRVR